MLWTLCCLQGDLHLYVVFFFWCFFSHPYHRIEHHVEHHEISFKKNGVELNSFITELSNFTVNNTLRRLFPVIQDQSPTNFCPVFKLVTGLQIALYVYVERFPIIYIHIWEMLLSKVPYN